MAKPNMPRIKKIWAFLAVDEDGDEGICAMLHHETNTWYPMVSADEARLEFLRGYAESLARDHGKKIVLAEFTTRTDIETIGAGH